jgi:glutamate synthase domain-containing protein 3
MYLDKIASVERLMPTAANNNKENYQAVGNYAAIRINVQPASAELTAVSEGVFGQTFQAFVTVSGIRIGDRITISGSGQKLIVKGIQDHNWGPIPHLEIVLFKGDA